MRKQIDFDTITETLTTDNGLTKTQRVIFHCYNKNGALALLPSELDNYCIGGRFYQNFNYLYSKYENYHAQCLMKMATGETKRYSRWDVAYHISKVKEDAIKGHAKLARKRVQHGVGEVQA